jgi:hypothetical protein
MVPPSPRRIRATGVTTCVVALPYANHRAIRPTIRDTLRRPSSALAAMGEDWAVDLVRRSFHPSHRPPDELDRVKDSFSA